jgi:phytoene/squalene synthetase
MPELWQYTPNFIDQSATQVMYRLSYRDILVPRQRTETFTMTPQEIVDYKRKWLGTARHETKIHSDYHRATRTWLKDHVPKHQWHIQEHTNVYESTVIFEQRNHQDSYLHWYGDKRA